MGFYIREIFLNAYGLPRDAPPSLLHMLTILSLFHDILVVVQIVFGITPRTHLHREYEDL